MLVTIYTSIAFVGKLKIPLSCPAKEIIAYYDVRINSITWPWYTYRSSKMDYKSNAS